MRNLFKSSWFCKKFCAQVQQFPLARTHMQPSSKQLQKVTQQQAAHGGSAQKPNFIRCRTSSRTRQMPSALEQLVSPASSCQCVLPCQHLPMTSSMQQRSYLRMVNHATIQGEAGQHVASITRLKSIMQGLYAMLWKIEDVDCEYLKPCVSPLQVQTRTAADSRGSSGCKLEQDPQGGRKLAYAAPGKYRPWSCMCKLPQLPCKLQE